MKLVNSFLIFILLFGFLNANVVELKKYPQSSYFNIINITEDRNKQNESYILFYDKFGRYSYEVFLKKIGHMDRRVSFLLIGKNRNNLINLSKKITEEGFVNKIYFLNY